MDFLSSRSDPAIRKEIRGIKDSYHHYWDLLAELLQNSRDAVNRKRSMGIAGPYFMQISIDSAINRIEVFDNGIGIPRSKIHEMLAPGGGDKDGSGAEVGEKGVGLTYAVFSGDNFEIESRVLGQPTASGQVLNALKWLKGESGISKPSFTEVQAPASSETIELGGVVYSLDSYTRIAVGGVLASEGDVNLFDMTRSQLKMLLRTRTAVGVTHHLFDPGAAEEFSVFVDLKLPTGDLFGKLEPSGYLVPHLAIPASGRIELETVRNGFVSRADGSARRKFLGGRSVYTSTTVAVGGWNIKVYGVMFPDNSFFRQLAVDPFNLITGDDENLSAHALFQSGIYVGTKGMPTGMKIEPKPGGRYPAYYRRCFFFVESPDLKFDLGRKSLHYKYVQRLQGAVAEVFSKFEEIAVYQGDAKPDSVDSTMTKAERRAKYETEWSNAENLATLDAVEIPYEKIPNKQEAAVAAVFHELLGAKVLKKYRTVSTGYSSRYDVHALYDGGKLGTSKIIIEFKHDLESLIRDLQEKSKYFNDIDLLIAWDADEQKLKSANFDLTAVSGGDYEGVTHTLQVPVTGVEEIPVILLRTFFDRRKTTKTANH